MSATIGECVCVGGDYTTITAVKEYVRYRLDDLPFTTARKINHLCCKICKGITDADANKEFSADLAKNRAFIAEQDKLYSAYALDEPIIKINGYVEPIDYLYKPIPHKQWHKGAIHYLSMLTVDDKVKIVPRIKTFEVYCDEQEVLSIAAKQFVKPDDYFKLTSVERFKPISQLSTPLPTRIGDA